MTPISLEALPPEALGIGAVQTEDDLANFIQQTIQGMLPPKPPISGGTGTPEGVVAAPVGSVFLRRDGGAATVLYVKETGGATSTGWVAK